MRFRLKTVIAGQTLQGVRYHHQCNNCCNLISVRMVLEQQLTQVPTEQKKIPNTTSYSLESLQDMPEMAKTEVIFHRQ